MVQMQFHRIQTHSKRSLWSSFSKWHWSKSLLCYSSEWCKWHMWKRPLPKWWTVTNRSSQFQYVDRIGYRFNTDFVRYFFSRNLYKSSLLHRLDWVTCLAKRWNCHTNNKYRAAILVGASISWKSHLYDTYNSFIVVNGCLWLAIAL